MTAPGSIADHLTADSRTDTGFAPSPNPFRERAIVTLAPDGKVLTWNAAAERLNGHLAEDVLGRNLSFLYPEQEKDEGAPSRHLREAAERGECRYDGVRVHKNAACFRAKVVLTACFGHIGDLEGFTEIAVRVDAEQNEVRPREDEPLRDRERLATIVTQGIFQAGLTLAGAIELAAHPDAVQRIQRAIGTLDETIREIRSLLVAGRFPDDLTLPDKPAGPDAHSPQDTGRNERTDAA